jgi:DNA-binding transcriptional LysR family regulator
MSSTFDEIAAFVEVVEKGSFRGAAAHLGLSTSVVSKRIRALEERLQTQLIQRTTRKLSLTQAGELFYGEVRKIPVVVAAAEERVRDFAGRIEGSLSVVMPTYLESRELHDIVIPAYLAAHPGIDLQLQIVTNPFERAGDDFDLIVAGRLPHARFPDTSLIGRRLLKFRGALFVSPAYLEHHGGPSHPAELDRHNCLSYPNREWHFTEPSGKPVIVTARGSLRTNSNQLLRAATVAGLGIAYSFPVFFADDLRAGRVVRLLDEYTARSFVDVHVFYPGTRFVPRRTRAFIDALVAHFSE